MSNKIDYNELARQLKGKTTFKIDLRKTDANKVIPKGSNRFSPAEKRNMLRAYRAIKQNNIANLRDIPRNEGESKKQYVKRMTEAKKLLKQGNTGLIGVFVDAPQQRGQQFNVVITGKGKDRRAITELIVPQHDKVDLVERMVSIDHGQFVEKGWEYIKELIDHYIDEWGHPANILSYHGAYRSALFATGFYTAKGNIKTALRNAIKSWQNKYSENDHAFTGLLFIYYV